MTQFVMKMFFLFCTNFADIFHFQRTIINYLLTVVLTNILANMFCDWKICSSIVLSTNNSISYI